MRPFSTVDNASTKRRETPARYGDLRLWLGIALVLTAIVTGVVVMRAGSDTVLVMRASRDLPFGAAPTGLVAVPVNRSAAGDAYLMDPPADGAVVRLPVHAGELVPRGAVSLAAPTSQRQVTVPVDPLHAPIGLQAGDRVDVWGTAATAQRDASPPHLVVANVRVASVSEDPVGVGGELAVVVDLDEADVAAVVEASRSQVVDLVSVPLDSQPLPSNAAGPDATVAAEGHS